METEPITGFINSAIPGIAQLPPSLKRIAVKTIEFLLCSKKINSLREKLHHLRGHSYNEQLLELLGVSFTLSNHSLQNIPAEGRVLIASNHPLGGLDGLLLLRAISLVRQDVKVLANTVLSSVENLNELFIPTNVFTGSKMKSGVEAVTAALMREEAVMIFPAGEVSRAGINGIKDKKWKKGIVYFSGLTKAPILPVHITGRNSLLFYLLSFISGKLSYLRLVSEIFNKKGMNFHINIAPPIPSAGIAVAPLLYKSATQKLRKHCYLTGKGKGGIFQSETAVASPEGRGLLRKELFSSACLYSLGKKSVFKVKASDSPITMREIARLREITFRKAGEGTGKRRDLDRYDMLYDHIILWDDELLEIAGSYRIGNGTAFTATGIIDSFYTTSLFSFAPRFLSMLPESLELGRSFIQEKYWRSNALDLLWMGIAAYIQQQNNCRYLFGPVSISAAFPDEIKQMMVFYFEKWYKPTEPYATAHLPVVIPAGKKYEFGNMFTGSSPKEDMKILKSYMKMSGYTIPVLFRQYTELCNEGGASFSAFNIDPLFNNCIDGFIVLDLQHLKEEKLNRYFDAGAASAKVVVA